jgi:hypothetical protein
LRSSGWFIVGSTTACCSEHLLEAIARRPNRPVGELEDEQCYA